MMQQCGAVHVSWHIQRFGWLWAQQFGNVLSRVIQNVLQTTTG
jgi:hypothetical protein